MALKKYITLEHLTTAVSALLNKIAEKANIEDLSDVAFSGSYTDLENKPDLTQYVSYDDVEDLADGTVDGPFMIKGTDYVTAGQASISTLGDCATAEGHSTTASGEASHAEGLRTKASGSYSHAEGEETIAYGDNSHAEGVGGYTNNNITIELTGAANTTQYNVVNIDDPNNLIEEYGIIGAYLVYDTGNNEFLFIATITNVSYDNNNNNISTITLSQSLGNEISNEFYQIYIGNAIGFGSHSEGITTAAISRASHAEGFLTLASGIDSHAEGFLTTASGESSHAEGELATASGNFSHVEGYATIASGQQSHAEGNSTIASGRSSHAEGVSTTASGIDSHAEGFLTTASGESSHAEGVGTTAQRRSQHVFGEYNILDTTGSSTNAKGSYIEIVGNGMTSTRSNARTLDWSGNETLAGTLTIGGANGWTLSVDNSGNLTMLPASNS